MIGNSAKVGGCLLAIWIAFEASPVRAGQVKCLWRGLSPATQEALIHAKSLNMTAPIPRLSPAEASMVVSACRITRATLSTASNALNAYALELAEKEKSDSETFPNYSNVEGVWDSLSIDDRANFREWITTRKQHRLDAEDMAHYAIVLHPLGVPEAQYYVALGMPKYVNAMTYFMARAVREQLESQF